MFNKTGLVILIAAAMLLGCNAGGDNPASGGLAVEGNLANADNKYDQAGGQYCWGIWQVSINPDTEEFEVTPARSVDFMANVTMFLQPPAGQLSNFVLRNMQFDFISRPGYIIVDVDVGLKHPFPGLNVYTGFDVRGVFMHHAQYSSTHDSGLSWSGQDTAMQLNPDGFTRWMNATEFPTIGVLGFTPGRLGTPDFLPTATLNPYKYFCDGLTEYDEVTQFFSLTENIENRGCFRPGNLNYRHYQLIWPDGPLDFQYAVIASYDEPDPDPPQNIPDDFPIAANCAEAFNLLITDNGSTAYYVDQDDKGGDLHLNLEVFDWGVLGHGTSITDEIGEITFESHGSIIPSPVTFDPSTLIVHHGSTVSSVYEIDIPGVNPSGLTRQTILCTVTSAIHDTYDYGFGVPVPDAPLASYTMYDVPVQGVPSDLPVAIATACTCLWVSPGESVTFSGAESWSPYGEITNWEWDFDGDGNFGDAYTGPAVNPTHTYDTSGEYIVNLRVTDETNATGTINPADRPVVHVGSFTNPNANAYICPTIGFIEFAGVFEGSDSTGNIDLYEWDFEGDCIWDYEHPTIGDTTHAYTEADIYNAILRVTGTGCDSVITEVRMIDPVGILENANFWDCDWDPWTHGNGGIGSKSETIVQSDTYKWTINFLRTSSSNDGGICYAQQIVDYDVSDLDNLYMNLFFNIISASLTGDGWMGGEMDMAVRIVYDDGTPESNAPYWRQAWFGWDLFTSDPGNQWQWDVHVPSYVTYHYQEKVSQNVWLEKQTCDLMTTLDPPPIEIKWVRIDSSGWDFNTYFALPWFSEE